MDYISPNSYWCATAAATGPAQYAGLNADVRADIAIIGAGITGLTAALHLKSSGKRIVVLEAGRVGAGTSGGTSGHLDTFPDAGLSTLVSDFGDEAVGRMLDARRAAIDQIESWSRQHQIECDMKRIPAYYYTETEAGEANLQKEHDTAKTLGLDATLVRNIPLPRTARLALRLERQGRFHALDYLNALAAQVHGGNATIHEHSAVVEPPEDGEPCTVRTAGGTVRADVVLVATHSAFFGISQFDMRVAPYQSYVLAAELEDDLEDALYWDDEQPYHYVRRGSSQNPALYLIGGCDHKTGQGDDEREALEQLRRYVHSRFTVREIHQQWSAEFFEPADGVPLVGRVPMTKCLYVATGFSGSGLTWGTAAGRLLADLAGQSPNPLAEILSPNRLKPLAAGPELIQENLNVARRWALDRFKAEAIDDLQQIRAGEGKLVKFNSQLLAVYRDEQGILHASEPQCTHAGCLVQWNEAERTWDCPCHGGRYAATGQRIYGPPPDNLGRAKLD